MSHANPVDTATLLVNEAGNYRVLPGNAAYCTGILPDAGYEVVRVQLEAWLPVNEAYRFIEAHLQAAGRPVQAFCGIEMRQPAPLTPDNWSAFNAPYLQQLRAWNLVHGDWSLVCRSNIALAVHAPQTASVCAFSYVRPGSLAATSFCLSGQADIGPGGDIIAAGEVGPEAMHQRARYTIDTLGASMAKLGLSWADARQVAIFHVHDIPALWGPELLGAVGRTLRNGVIVYRARPPIAGGEVELEARGAGLDVVISTR